MASEESLLTGGRNDDPRARIHHSSGAQGAAGGRAAAAGGRRTFPAKGLVPGEMHLSAGQEPVAAGICAHLTTDDAVTATHRPHHLANATA